MSVMYDYDPGRLELYRPRADGLLGRCLCGSAVIHLLVACLLLTVRLPKPPEPKRRPYHITEVTLLPRPRPAAPSESPRPKPVAEQLGPRDLSLFLHDLAPAETKRSRRPRRARRARLTALRTAALPKPAPTRELKPEAPDTDAGERVKAGKQLASDLPHFLERPMVDRDPPDPVKPPAETPARRRPGGSPKTERPKAVFHPTRTEVPAPRPPKPAALRPRPVVEAPKREDAGGDHHEVAPRPVEIARAEHSRAASDLLPKQREDGGSTGPSHLSSVPVAKPPPTPAEQPTDLPTGRTGAGKRIAELPGSLFGDGSGQGPTKSRREPALPEGRSGAADTPGPRRPRVSRGAAGHTESVTGGDAGGFSAVPAPGGLRLSEDDRRGSVARGEPTGFGEKGGKGTREASLPSSGSEVSGRGSGAAPSGDGAGGGYGADGPRSFGGGARAGRPSRSATPKASRGDGTGGTDPALGTGIGIGGSGPGASGGDTEPRSGGGHSSGAGLRAGDAPGKQVTHADLPGDGSSEAGRGIGHGSGSGSTTGSGTETGPKSFGTGDRRRVSPRGGDGSSRGDAGGRGKGNGDEGGVALPGGAGDGDDGPGRGAADEGDSGFKGSRKKPTGVYVDTTGNYTLPGAIYQGDYHYNERSLRKIMDELNSRTKVKVRLGGSYESIAPGSFRKAPVVVFTGHKAFELTEEQRKLLKEYVDKGGMIWADLSKSAFDRSFREEMEKIFGSAPAALAPSHPIYRSFYVLNGPPPGDFGDTAPFQGITVDGRLGVVITPNRYFSAVTKSLNTRDEDQEGAIQAVVNVYIYAVANLRAVKDQND